MAGAAHLHKKFPAASPQTPHNLRRCVDALEKPQLHQLLSDSSSVIWDLNVIFGNSEFYSVTGKEKQFFSLIFLKIRKFCSAELLVSAVSASNLLVSPRLGTLSITPVLVPPFPLVVGLCENLQHLE